MYKDKQTEEEKKKREGSRAGARLYRLSSEENSVAGGRVPDDANFPMRPGIRATAGSRGLAELASDIAWASHGHQPVTLSSDWLTDLVACASFSRLALPHGL